MGLAAIAFSFAVVLHLSGDVTEGGATGTFEKFVDLATGYSRTAKVSGPHRDVSGFNGARWSNGNGISVEADLPATLSTARAVAFVDRLGWRDGSEPDVRVSQSGDTTTATVDADWGPLTIALSDWRAVAGIRYPFLQTSIEATGDTSTLRVRSVSVLDSVPASTFAMPSPVPHAAPLKETAAVTFTYAGKRDPHTIVDVKVNGHDARVIFDTGGANYFDPGVVSSWGVPIAGGTSISGPGTGSLDGGYARVDSISIGEARLLDEVAFVGPLPWPSGPQHPDAPIGIAGFEFLAEFRTTIDYPNQTIAFAPYDVPSTERGTVVPFYCDGHAIYVWATANGKAGLFRIDTGASKIVIFRHFAEANGIRPAGAADSSGRGVGGNVTVRPGRLDTFGFAGTTLRDVPVEISQTGVGGFASRTLAGNIGGRLLRCYRLTFDFQKRTMTAGSEPRTQACLGQLQGS